MSNSIYIHGLGKRNPVTEAEQIIWFLEQGAKNYKPRFHTQYWGRLKEMYKPVLLKYEAFEVLAFINDKTTTAQEKRRKEAQERTRTKNEQELKAFSRNWKQQRFKANLINSIHYN